MKGFQSRPAARWEEGLLCGNGNIGAMVMGWPKEETIYFTHEKLPRALRFPSGSLHTAGHLELIRRMMLDRYEGSGGICGKSFLSGRGMGPGSSSGPTGLPWPAT